jgi:hypothetical protein
MSGFFDENSDVFDRICDKRGVGRKLRARLSSLSASTG